MNEAEIPEKPVNCHRHPEVEAMGACLGCAKPVCETCGQWYNGRLYCPLCYANVEIFHAMAESPIIDNVPALYKPDRILGILLIGMCLMIIGASFFFMRRTPMGLFLSVCSVLIPMGVLYLAKHSPAFNAGVRKFYVAVVIFCLSINILVLLFILSIQFKIIHFF